MTCWWNWIEWGGNVRIQAITETAIYVDDLQAAETFYGTILGLRVMGKEPGRHVFFQVGEGTAARSQRAGPFRCRGDGGSGEGAEKVV